ncbi:GNAT family N-acetyltransferase [Pseudactinotalea sp. Z1748]|uniref:GNAT family N-acetyltransferase n=1 Tax=Pseudactinotalea sp. Z1748 TaxID=3413027 RepID=UPI003C7BAC2C
MPRPPRVGRGSLRDADLRHGLRHGDLVLRRMNRSDRAAWQRLRESNIDWLTPWEATNPGPPAPSMTFAEYVRQQRAQARQDIGYAYVLEWRGQVVGQLTIAGVARGSLHSAHIGYWISEHVAGRGLMTRAVALAIDHSFGALGLHRVEINVRPENAASLRVPQKLGLREEGLRRRYLHIQGQWRDHRSFAITAEEAPGSLLDRLPAPE